MIVDPIVTIKEDLARILTDTRLELTEIFQSLIFRDIVTELPEIVRLKDIIDRLKKLEGIE